MCKPLLAVCLLVVQPCSYITYMFLNTFTELKLVASSSIPVVDLSSELTHSIDELPVDKSSHTGRGFISDCMTEVS